MTTLRGEWTICSRCQSPLPEDTYLTTLCDECRTEDVWREESGRRAIEEALSKYPGNPFTKNPQLCSICRRVHGMEVTHACE